MARLLLVGAAGSRPGLLRRLAARHQVTVLGVGAATGTTRYRRVEVPDLCPTTLVKAARELDGRFHGVLCWDQLATFAANQVAAALGLPPIWHPPESNLADKGELCTRWHSQGVPCPPTVLATPGTAPPDGPSVIKPGAMMGGIGARLCPDAAEATAAIARLAAALTGDGPDGWAGALLRRHGLPSTILAQGVVPVDPTPAGERLEYSAEVAVARGEPRLVCVFAKTHVPPPHFAESSFLLPPPPGAPVWQVDVPAAVYPAVRAAGVMNAMVELEFCLSGGVVTFFELNPRIIGDPAPAAIEDVYRIPVADLLAALAVGDRTTAWRILDAAAPYPVTHAAFIDVRAGEELAGRVFRGLAPGRTPLRAVDAVPVLTHGEPIRVSPLRGPTRLATVVLHAGSAVQRADWVDHWLSPRSIRTSAPPARPGGPMPARAAAGPTFVTGAAELSTMDWLRYADQLSLSPPWLSLSAGLPDLIRLVTVVLQDERGLLAGLPCWVCRRARSTYDPVQATGLAAEPVAGPVILAGSRIGYSSRPLLRPDLSTVERRTAIAGLVAGVRALAERERAAEAWLMHADDATARELHPLSAAPSLHLPPVAVVPVGSQGYRRWVDGQSRRRRAALGKEALRWAADGLDIEMVPLAGVVDEAAGLLAAHNRRFGSEVSDAAMGSFLGLHAAAFGDDALAFTYREGGQLQAFAHAVEWRDQVSVRVYGERDGRRRTDGLYFYLTVHLPLRLAALRAVPAVDLGPSTYRAKTLHGAVLQARWAVPLVTGQVIDATRRAANRAHIERELEGVGWQPPKPLDA